ncbi:hypothetical protein [Gordonia sp. (in: high G+C Gram-positive bacteria)]|uniref:hypothetical protein n=1 Tax=Gordonia sp. (in: high G+C Gram-positive bacteria) TaxID=84139 RepID=UPI003C76054A
MAGDQQRRIVIQTHVLRAAAAERAARHGSGEARSAAPFVKLLLIAVAIAFVILTGVIVADMIVDLLSSGRR